MEGVAKGGSSTASCQQQQPPLVGTNSGGISAQALEAMVAAGLDTQVAYTSRQETRPKRNTGQQNQVVSGEPSLGMMRAYFDVCEPWVRKICSKSACSFHQIFQQNSTLC